MAIEAIQEIVQKKNPKFYTPFASFKCIFTIAFFYIS